MTCRKCATPRESQPFEDYVGESHETMAWCSTCRGMTKHVVGIALVKKPKRKPTKKGRA